MHECKEVFKTEIIDNCCGEGYNRCFEDQGKLILEIWYLDQNGIEDFCDNWTLTEVKFCPFCGYQPERLNPETHKKYVTEVIDSIPSKECKEYHQNSVIQYNIDGKSYVKNVMR